jgi:5-methylthioribose kinase
MIGHGVSDLRSGREGMSAGGPQGYRELNTATAARYAAQFLEGEIRSSAEVGDGNLNNVFRVSSGTSSVIIKQALPYLKVAGSQWPLTRQRAHIEADALAVHSQFAPGLLPQVLHFDETLSANVFEDLRGYRSWRDVLVEGLPSPGVARQVGQYSAAVLLGTSDLIRPLDRRDHLRRRFSYSDLCLVTEDLVFTAPFTGAASNRYDDELTGLVRGLLRDRVLRMAVSGLLSAFKTRPEALIHGDLHTGSVLVKGSETRVIDLEFAFYGPFGFDPGMLLANLALSHIAHQALNDVDFSSAVAQYAGEYWTAFADGCRRLWPLDEPSCDQFLSSVLADAARFAGVEMIRRIVGLAHVRDIDSLPKPARPLAQQRAVSCGRALITGTACRDIDEFWLRATEEVTVS